MLNKMKNQMEITPELQAKVLQQLFSGTPLTGKDGAFGPMLKQILEAALEGEMNAHLSERERSKGNKRNGKGIKTVKTTEGEIILSTPQDRHSTFTPAIIKKRETVLAGNLTPKILALYGLGTSFRDISAHLKEIYDVDISHTTLSEITDSIIPRVKEWQDRPIEEMYPILWLDAMHYKVRDSGRVVSRAVYNVLALNKDGVKEIIGTYVSESEGARFWLSVLTDLKNRGLKDILIACIDNLNGFAEAIRTLYPKVEIQSCVIHQIRNSLKYISRNDKSRFMADLKFVYKAVNESAALMALDHLDKVWGKKYPVVLKSWYKNWDKLSTYFAYDELIRRLIYTTNIVEGYHRQVRKVTKTKGTFPNDMAVLKLIYLATENISKKWTQPLKDWKLTIQKLHIMFGDRMPIDV
jgi:putative transposase